MVCALSTGSSSKVKAGTSSPPFLESSVSCRTLPPPPGPSPGPQRPCPRQAAGDCTLLPAGRQPLWPHEKAAGPHLPPPTSAPLTASRPFPLSPPGSSPLCGVTLAPGSSHCPPPPAPPLTPPPPPCGSEGPGSEKAGAGAPGPPNTVSSLSRLPVPNASHCLEESGRPQAQESGNSERARRQASCLRRSAGT